MHATLFAVHDGFEKTSLAPGLHVLSNLHDPDEIDFGLSENAGWDDIQPILAVLSLALLPTCFFMLGWLAEALVLLGLAATTLAMTRRILSRTQDSRYALFAPLSWVRAYARGIGLSRGTCDAVRKRLLEGPPDRRVPPK